MLRIAREINHQAALAHKQRSAHRVVLDCCSA
jgi:hypothetical protein